MRAQLEQCAQDFALVLGQQYALKTAIKRFFQFLAQEKGITNEAVLKSFHC